MFEWSRYAAAERGKILLLALIAIDIGNMLYRLAISINLRDEGIFTEVIITSLIVLALYRLLYLGYVWAKWVTVVISALDGVWALYFAFLIVLPHPTHLDLTLLEISQHVIIGIIFLIFSLALVYSKNINSFLADQNAKLALAKKEKRKK